MDMGGLVQAQCEPCCIGSGMPLHWGHAGLFWGWSCYCGRLCLGTGRVAAVFEHNS